MFRRRRPRLPDGSDGRERRVAPETFTKCRRPDNPSVHWALPCSTPLLDNATWQGVPFLRFEPPDSMINNEAMVPDEKPLAQFTFVLQNSACAAIQCRIIMAVGVRDRPPCQLVSPAPSLLRPSPSLSHPYRAPSPDHSLRTFSHHHCP